MKATMKTIRQTLKLSMPCIAMTLCGAALSLALFASPVHAQPLGLSPYVQQALDFIPHAINDENLIVGQQGAAAVRYSAGTRSRLPFIEFAGQSYSAVAVNNSGMTIGTSSLQQLAGLFWQAPYTSLGGWLEQPLTGLFTPVTLNKLGVVVGNTRDAQQAYRWRRTGGFELLLTPTRGQFAQVNDINDSGAAVGAMVDGDFSLLLWPANTNVATRLIFSGNKPFILNSGEIVAAKGHGINYLSPQRVPSGRDIAPAGSQVFLTGVSEQGRLIGEALVEGKLRGWTALGKQGAVVWLLPLNAQADEHLKPVGVNACGNIVAQVVNGNGVAVRGELHLRNVTCDKTATDVKTSQ
jgi:hypothetical protein